jgi:hypothetical protein
VYKFAPQAGIYFSSSHQRQRSSWSHSGPSWQSSFMSQEHKDLNFLLFVSPQLGLTISKAYSAAPIPRVYSKGSLILPLHFITANSRNMYELPHSFFFLLSLRKPQISVFGESLSCQLLTSLIIVTSSADCRASYSVGSIMPSSLLFLPLSTILLVFACEMDGRLLSKERGTICDLCGLT